MMAWLSPENIGRLVTLLAVALLSSWITRACTVSGDDDVSGVALVYQPGLISGYDDLSATRPVRVTFGDLPDSTVAWTIDIPAWYSQGIAPRGERSDTSTDEAGDVSALTSSTDSKPITTTPSARLPTNSFPQVPELSTFPFVTVPMKNGSPSLSVSSTAATLQAFSPQGRPLEYTYDIPEPTWRLTSGLRATAGPGFGVLTADLQLRHRTPIGWVGLGPAAIAHADRWSYWTGIGATVTLESTLYSR